jgi:hypothetical protein
MLVREKRRATFGMRSRTGTRVHASLGPVRKNLSGLTGGFAMVARAFAPFGRQAAPGEKGLCFGAETQSALMNGGLQLGENRLQLVRIVSTDCAVTKFPDAVIESTSAQSHSERIPVI